MPVYKPLIAIHRPSKTFKKYLFQDLISEFRTQTKPALMNMYRFNDILDISKNAYRFPERYVFSNLFTTRFELGTKAMSLQVTKHFLSYFL